MGQKHPLTTIPLFEELSAIELRQLSERCVEQSFPSGEYVFTEGDQATKLYMLVEGTVQVLRKSGSDKEIKVAELGPGEFFGELSFLDSEPRSASLKTTSPCKFLSISQKDFTDAAKYKSNILWCVLKALCKRIRHISDDIAAEKIINSLG